MAQAEGLDIQKGEDALAFEELEGGDLSCIGVSCGMEEAGRKVRWGEG